MTDADKLEAVRAAIVEWADAYDDMGEPCPCCDDGHDDCDCTCSRACDRLRVAEAALRALVQQ